MAVAWPIGLNQNTALLAGYSEEREDNVATQKPQVGPPNRRRRSYIPSSLITFRNILTFDEFDILDAWYDDDLKSGVLAFTRYHPRKGSSTTITATFEERPKRSEPISGTQYMVDFKIRVYE